MGLELVGIFLAVYDLVVAGCVLLVLGVAMAAAAVRLVPKGEPRHGFVVGALKTTLLLLGIAGFLLLLVLLESAS